MLFCTRVSAFRKRFLVKDSISRLENNIFLYIAHKVIIIILISNKYYQFRMWCKFISINFIGEKHICSIVKDTDV